jgi:hypothetical protein
MAARHSGNPEEQLIVHGSLVPGDLYHFLLGYLPETWEQCIIRGRMGKYGGSSPFNTTWRVRSTLAPNLPGSPREIPGTG